MVLIVAKCIVNMTAFIPPTKLSKVLIVAKCIVNQIFQILLFLHLLCINSSKVYCKCPKSTSDLFISFSINSSKVYCKSY